MKNVALICHRFDTKGFAAFPRGCHQPESPDTQDFSALHHRIYHVAPFGTGVRCVPSASDRCASHSAVRAKLKISFKQLSTGSIPVTSTTSSQALYRLRRFSFKCFLKIAGALTPLLLLSAKGPARFACSLASALATANCRYQPFAVFWSSAQIRYKHSHQKKALPIAVLFSMESPLQG